MNEFLEQFLLEARELAEQATSELLALERTPADKERLDSAFRAFHTLKGGAGIVDFTAMSRAVHAAEDALSAVRSGDRVIGVDLIGDCLSCIDLVVQWLDEIQATGDLPAAPDKAADAIVARFGYEADPARQDEAARPAESKGSLSAMARRVLDEQLLLIAQTAPAGREGRVASAALVAANVLRHASLDAHAALVALAGGDAAALVDAITRALEAQQPETGAPSSQSDTATRTLRVDAQRVNALVNITGELIVAKNAISHVAKLAEESGNALAPALWDEHARLERLTAGLQHAVLSLRVLPLRTVFQRFSRVVRELAVGLSKPTVLAIEGEDTEADKAIVEMLFEPLLHVVRNAMDHGIETAAEREAAGKQVNASIRLSARQRGEHVVIEVHDDGKGIDVARVRKTAAARRIATEEALSAMSGQDVVDLIFMPGFSTAQEVTGLSGRGVGMDAVRTAVERIGGRVTVNSEPGRGSTVRFTLPFSMMMTRVMTIEAGGQMFGIPLDSVVETVRLSRDQIQAIGTAGAFVVRNRTIPLINLAQTLGGKRPEPEGPEAIAVIASISGQLGALEVDRLGERMDVMLKPIEGLLSGTPGIAGTTLMGDGRVLLILDLQELLA
jgi:two-component system, chemotaxis family, sensor kinase CheA